MDRPTMRQLEALDLIAREGSFRAAARALGISQVAVSDHVRQLETRLGVSLFDRAPGGKARLSGAGEAALTRARMILADCDALVTTMLGFAGAEPAKAPAAARKGGRKESQAEASVTGEAVAPPISPVAPEPVPISDPAPKAVEASHADRPIMIGTHASILARFQDKLAAFEDAFADRPVSVDFNCFVADRVALALSEGAISMAYFYALGETRVFPSDYLWSERWTLYVGQAHRLAQRELVDREELLPEGLLSFAPGNRLRPLIEACFAQAGLGALPFLIESDDYGHLVEQARAGTGILPLFGPAAARIGASAGLVRLPYVDPIPAIEVRRVVHPSLAEDDEVQALVATLQ
jgi:molybdate transport repressor ModE-like protein